MEIKKGFADKYFLEKIYLSGYKSIQQTEIELKSNFNIIIGKNGAGKTNFMELLNKVINDNVDDIPAFKSILYFNGEKKIRVEAGKKIAEDAFKQNQVFNNNDTFFLIYINDRPYNYPSLNYSNLVGLLRKENFIVNSTFIRHGIPSELHFVAEPSSITVRDEDLAKLPEPDSLIKYPFFVSSLFATLLLEDYQFDHLSEFEIIDTTGVRNELSTLIFSQINILRPHLKQFSPISDVRFNQNFNVFESGNRKRVKITNLFLEFKVNGNWYLFSDLSDGTRRLFYIISEVSFPDFFFFRYAWFGRAEISSSRIILIEEPELGIHPHQFHNLMTFLKVQSQTKQIIITTHSPEALDILYENELDSIILSEYDQEKGTLLRHMTDKEKLKAKMYMKEDYLSDYWMHSNLETAN